MRNTRVLMIVGALAAVLMSAFAAERAVPCHRDRACERARSLLPLARFLIARAAEEDAARAAAAPGSQASAAP